MPCPKSNMDIVHCDELLNVAEALVEEHGVVSFRFAQIAKDAQCSNHTLYKYFRSREDVLVCLFLRNCTSNYLPLFLKQNPDLTPWQRAALAAVFSNVAVQRNATFDTLRVVSINSLFWQPASDEKGQLLRQRVNLFWDRVRFHVQQAADEGALLADSDQVLELTQSLYFFMAGILSSYESQLMSERYLTERDPTFYRHLAKVLGQQQWNIPLDVQSLEVLGDRVNRFFDENYLENKSCRRCRELNGLSDIPALNAALN
ncbi:TetR/AcrR family transcriptional regulator [Ferrimonas balearica]|uniref:TetR/AcrR family transcriptional regulator n=1 Tax=Ferrimonas balearica TaxID=44012 RepID=UPI001C5910C8|nr:TetR/AcrR family transcriptional regulator [Ferrimonas balearica]MBW3163745.1 TetR/AcrR family transcriptional regulator [Ferrimonas balearica]